MKKPRAGLFLLFTRTHDLGMSLNRPAVGLAAGNIRAAIA